jgi:hypothetical protein
LCAAIANGEIASAEGLQQACQEIHTRYTEDSWIWTHRQCRTSLELNLDEISVDQARECIARYCEQQQKFLRLVLLDAEREYDEGSRVGFGLDDPNAADADFTAVRGRFEENSFVKQVTADIASLPARCEAVSSQLNE